MSPRAASVDLRIRFFVRPKRLCGFHWTGPVAVVRVFSSPVSFLRQFRRSAREYAKTIGPSLSKRVDERTMNSLDSARTNESTTNLGLDRRRTVVRMFRFGKRNGLNVIYNLKESLVGQTQFHAGYVSRDLPPVKRTRNDVERTHNEPRTARPYAGSTASSL
jgi:hypothetical protein